MIITWEVELFSFCYLQNFALVRRWKFISKINYENNFILQDIFNTFYWRKTFAKVYLNQNFLNGKFFSFPKKSFRWQESQLIVPYKLLKSILLSTICVLKCHAWLIIQNQVLLEVRQLWKRKSLRFPSEKKQLFRKSTRHFENPKA